MMASHFGVMMRVKVKLDTGAEINVITLQIFKQIYDQTKIEGTITNNNNMVGQIFQLKKKSW